VRARALRAPLAALGSALLATGCILGPSGSMPRLASAVVSPDFETYELKRVGLLPFTGSELSVERSLDIQRALQSELSQSTPFEIVPLGTRDLEELEASEPLRRGWYEPDTIIDLARGHSLDGILFGSVMQERSFPPLALSLSVDLVSAETGLVIWSGVVHLDASDPRVVKGLRTYYGGASNPDSWRVALISPERFARFATFQVACLL
jgi:hypothetical protein